MLPGTRTYEPDGELGEIEVDDEVHVVEDEELEIVPVEVAAVEVESGEVNVVEASGVELDLDLAPVGRGVDDGTLAALAAEDAGLPSEALDRVVSDQSRPLGEDELVDEAGKESFPASDPPSWTLGVGPRSRD